MSSAVADTYSIAPNTITEKATPLNVDDPQPLASAEQKKPISSSDHHNDEEADDDTSGKATGEFAVDVEPPEVTITTAEQLTTLVLRQEIQSATKYVVDIDGHKAIFKPGDPQLPLTFLAFSAVSSPTIDVPLALANREKLLSFEDFKQNEVPKELLEKPILHLASLISFGSGKLRLPYGVYDVNLKISEEKSVLNPIVASGIYQFYESSMRSFNVDWKSPLQQNLKEIIGIETGNFIRKISAAIEAQPELKEIASEDIIPQLRILIDFFRSSVLPTLSIDQDFKRIAGRSMLSANKISDEEFSKVSACLFLFIAQYPPLAMLVDAARKLREGQKIQLAQLCGLDCLMGIDNVAKLATDARNYLNLVPTDAVNKAGSSVVDSARYEQISNITRTEIFCLPKFEEEDQGEIELTGRSSRACDLENLNKLEKKHPHFSPVTEYLRPFIQASFLTTKPFRFPPLLVAGPPGIGKSKFMSDLVEALDLGRFFMQSSEFTCGSALVGLQKSWSNGSSGYVTDALFKTKTFNPVLVFDEVDKIRTNTSGNGISVDSALMRLLEPVEAKNFHDSYHNMPHDVSSVNWVFTCNSPMNIPYALATRLQKICVYPPTEAQAIDNVHRSIWSDLLINLQIDDLVYAELNSDILDFLRDLYYEELQFRKTYQLLQRGCNSAILDTEPGRKALLTLDMLLKKPPKHDKPRPRLLQ